MIIITEELVKRAIALVVPSAEAILATEDAIWGPCWVKGIISVPGLDDISFCLGEETPWQVVWGEKRDFSGVAKKKLQVAKRLRMTTSVVIATCPWLLLPDEYLYPGGVYRDGIACGVSGAKGRADEALAEMVISAVIMLAHLKTDRRIENKQMQI